MKTIAILTSFLVFFSLNTFGQTYASLPYSTSFESGTLDASWVVVQEGAPSANRTRVEVTNAYTAFHGNYDLNFDNIGNNTTRTGEAWLYLDLSTETEITMSFYYKDYADEPHTGANGDGVYFSDDSGATFVEYHINPDLYEDFQWHRISIDVDAFAAANGLSLNDSFIIKFQQRDNTSIDESEEGQATPASDGVAFDSIYIRAGGVLTAGKISGNQTLCGGGSTINITNVEFPTEGDNVYSYTWQTSTDLVSWTPVVTPSSPNLTLNGPFANSFWVRRGVESPIGSGGTGEGPVYTTPSYMLVTPETYVTFFGLNTEYCNNEPTHALTPSPPGGSFANSPSTGVSGSNFNPSTATSSDAGTVNEVIYEFTDAYGCTYADTQSTIVKNAPVVDFPDNLGTYVDNDLIINYLSATPPGGEFLGPGVINGNEFVPAFSGGAGTKIISYTYTSANGCTDVETIDANIVPNSGGVFGGVVSPVCEDGANMNITTSVPVTWTTYSDGSCWDRGWYNYCGNPAFTVNSRTSMTFRPSVAGPGTYYIYHYSWETANPSNYIFKSTVITVQAIPTLTINNLDPSYCLNSPSTSLNASFSDGSTISSETWSGTGMSGNLFVPSNAGVGGPYLINLTASNGVCSASTSASTSVNALPTLSVSGFDASYCTNSPLDSVFGSPVGGNFTATSGIFYNNLDTLVYNPSAVSPGTRSINYTYTDGNGCTNQTSFNTTIFSAPSVSILNLQNSYCEDNAPVTITGNQAPFGTFFGPSTGFTDNTNGTADFSPSIPTPDSLYTIGYTYTDANSCTDTAFRAVQINALPIINFTGLSPEYCISDDEVFLEGSPAAGSFSGVGITGAIFDPGFAVGTHNITYTFTDGNGCTNDTTKQTIVHDLPVVSFSGLNPEYCKDDEIDTLIGNQVGGYFNGVQVGTVFNDISYLNVSNPNFLPETPYNISYAFTDANGCFNVDTQSFVVHPLPIPNFTGLQTRYCEDDANTILIGSVNAGHPYGFGSSSFFGLFTPNDINNTALNQAEFNPTQVPIAFSGGQTQDTISFVYIDNKGCRDTISKPTTVHGLPVIAVGMTDSTLCREDAAVTLNISRPGGAGTETYSLLPSNTTLAGNLFDPGNANAITGSNTIVFQFEDQYSCINYDSTNVVVYPEPIVDFYLGSFCNNDSISFFDSSTIDAFDAGVNDDVIQNWFWTFGEGGNDSLQNPKYQYDLARPYTITLTATTREGCVASFSEEQLVGEPPVAQFSWDNICFGEQLQFTDFSTAQAVDPITTWSWNFGDGSTSGVQNPTYTYPILNSYDVMLALITSSGCIDTLYKRLNIRPVIDNYPYVENFEAGNGGWFANGQSNGIINDFSWQLGVANGNIIRDSANVSWVTNLTGDHNDNEQSFVDGPCFDFTNLTRPMIVMDIWADMFEGSDGAALQYSLDNGVSWNVIGEIGDGINWYNRTSVSGNPGGQAINQYGWSYQDSNWVEARHDLDILIGEPQVQLRVAFGSDATSSNEGIAFDNVQIRERSKITLLEYFTNSSDANSIQNDEFIDNLVFTNRKDLIDIQYHTDFPGSDEMNAHNPSDPSARALFYGAFNTGRAVLNGNAYNGISSEIATNKIKLQMLKDSPYSLVVGAENDGTELTATAYIRPNVNIDDADITLHLAVVESQITDLNGLNGDTEFRSVLKKMMPTATGTFLKRSFTAGEEVGISESWTLENVFDVNKLNVVAFIQDNVTKEVYQVSTTDTSAVPPVVVPPLSNAVLKQDLKMKLFPNPANNHLTLLFNQPIGSSKIQFIDISGKVLNDFKFSETMEYVSFELDYPSGMYYVRVLSENKVMFDKVIISK